MSKVAPIFPSSTRMRRVSLERMARLSADVWKKRGEQMALGLARYALQHVPAYRAHVKNILTGRVRAPETLAQFAKLPLVTKQGYLRAHSYTDLFPPLGLHSATTVSATSGSTGEPFFFPRGPEHDLFYERSLELLLKRQWGVGSRSTLVIIGFGLGIWIGGIFTYKNLNKLAEGELPMTVIPVGPNKELFLKSFTRFAEHYDQIILMGYPPFIKDLLDAGARDGIDWRSHRLRILTAAEGYSERFRNHLAEVSGADPVSDFVNIYGTVEQGTVAHETALANMIRRISLDRPEVFKLLFPKAQNVPTLAQYFPDHVYFEEVDGQVVATGYGSSIPLIRYAFSDLGGVIQYDEMREKLALCGIQLDREIKKHGIGSMVMQLPFVYVYARADFVIIFRGAKIYPEELRNALDNPIFGKVLTGRLSAERIECADLSQRLDIHVELSVKTKPSARLEKQIRNHLVAELRAKNSEFANNYAHDAAASTPRIVLHKYEDPAYFGGPGKQRWVKKV